MTKRHLTLLAGLLAAATFGMPAHAGHSPEIFTDGYTLADRDREHNFQGRELVPATPRQQAQLAYAERSRSVSDGFSEDDWDKQQSAELQAMMAKMANDPKIEALFSYFDAQRRALDGRG
jgi:hypothetical protein